MPEPASILVALTAASREQRMKYARPGHFTAGTALFNKGDDGSWLYLTERCLVEISRCRCSVRRPR